MKLYKGKINLNRAKNEQFLKKFEQLSRLNGLSEEEQKEIRVGLKAARRICQRRLALRITTGAKVKKIKKSSSLKMLLKEGLKV